mgnify:CR=1 FL=1
MQIVYFHPSVKQAAHKKYADEVLSEIAWCQENRDGLFKDALEKEYNNLKPSRNRRIQFDLFLQKAYELIDGKSIQVLYEWKTDMIVNSMKKDVIL